MKKYNIFLKWIDADWIIIPTILFAVRSKNKHGFNGVGISVLWLKFQLNISTKLK
jgi:hypothetical protein